VGFQLDAGDAYASRAAAKASPRSTFRGFVELPAVRYVLAGDEGKVELTQTNRWPSILNGFDRELLALRGLAVFEVGPFKPP